MKKFISANTPRSYLSSCLTDGHVAFRSTLKIVYTAWLLMYKNYPITGLDRALGLQEFEVPRISRQSAHEYSEVVNSTHRPPLPLRRYPGAHFCCRVS
jgi:hypothetical protein